MPSSNAIRAGRAFVELFADDSQLVRGLRRAERRVRTFGDRVQSIGRRMAGLGIAAATPLGVATKVFVGFDDQMRAVQAVIGATGDEFDALTEKAKYLGRTTSYTAAQVAAGMLELGRAGFAPKQIDLAIASILDLARATGTELPEAANLAANTLRSFGMDADQMGRVVDVMTATANNSAQTLIDLGEAMKYTAPVAAEYGLTLEETAKILGALANFGIKGSMAGTTMKNILLRLANPTIRKQVEALGVSVLNAQGDLRDASTILRDIGQVVEQLPKGEKLAIFNKIFGMRAIAGGAKLTASEFDRLNSAIDQATGTAARTAKVMDSGIGGALRRLYSAIEGIAISIGDALAKPLSIMADWLSKVAGSISEWIDNNQQAVVTTMKLVLAMTAGGIALMALGAVITSVGIAIGALGSIIAAVGTGFGVLASAVAFLVTPVGAVAAAVVALGGALVYLSDIGSVVLNWLGKKFKALKDTALKAYQGIANALASGDIQLAAKILWLTLKMAWISGLNALEKLWQDSLHWMQGLWTDTWYGLLATVEIVAHSLEVGWIETTSFFAKAWMGFAAFFSRTWQRIKAEAKKAWNWIKSLFDDSFDLKAENKLVEQQKQKAIAGIDDEQQRKLAEREAKRQAERRRNRNLHQATLGVIGQQNLDKRKQLDDEHARQLAINEAELARAIEQWRSAIQKAEQSSSASSDDPPTSSLMSTLKDAMAGIGTQLSQQASKVTSSGTFNAAALAGLQAGDATDRMANGIDKIEKNTRPLRDADSIAFT